MTTSRKADGTFSKGVSGNPKGRPRRSQPRGLRMPASAREVIFESAESLVKVRTAEGEVEMQTLPALLLVLRNKALQGDMRAAKLWWDHYNAAKNVHGPETVFTQWLLNYQDKLEAELEELRKQVPEIKGGTVVLQPNGRVRAGTMADDVGLLDHVKKARANRA